MPICRNSDSQFSNSPRRNPRWSDRCIIQTLSRARAAAGCTSLHPRKSCPRRKHRIAPNSPAANRCHATVGNSATHPCAPNLLHRGPAHPQLFGHRPGAPMRLALGLECRVASTIASTVSTEIDGLGPWPSRTSPSLASPFSANRVRHARTVTAVTPKLAAIRVLATPSAAINSARARCICRCGASRPRRPVSPSGRPGEEVMDRARLRPGGHRRRVMPECKERGRGTLPPRTRHASVYRLRSSVFSGLPCLMNAEGISS